VRTTTAALVLLLAAGPAAAECRAPGPFEARNGDARLTATIIGRGPAVLMIPSLGRGPADFDDVASAVAGAGFTAIRFDPRWFGRSDGPEVATLFDLAADAAAVSAAACPGQKVIIVGHAFGNRVARAMAASRPDQVASVVLLAAGGKLPIAPDISTAIGVSASEGLKPDAERLAALRLAFFAKGRDPSVWLTGWSPRATELQARASRAQAAPEWWGAGAAPILIVQPTEDPVAPVANGEMLKAEIGDRAVLVRLPHTSHAILPEQPAAVSAVILKWLRGVRDARALQAAIDRKATRP
jgi:pimeloyl-ACP methyl ester carboxylesterase